MQLKAKIVLLAVLPLLLSLLAIGISVLDQQRTLARQTQALVRDAYMKSRRTELKNYVDLAIGTLQPLATSTSAQRSPQEEAELQRRALQALEALNYGHDGYFFVYDEHGTVLMHSRQPELIGRNLWNLTDTEGRYTIQRLLAQAKAGGGYVDYLWRKPSSGQMSPKLGYVELLPPWGWMVGTGLYLDDIQATLAELDTEMNNGIRTTLGWLMALAAGGTVAISICGLMLNLREHREADAKLRLMARQVVRSQEEERAHLARELHDGTSQTLVAGKLLIESAVVELEGRGQTPPDALAQALKRLNDALHEVRHLSHSLRPTLLDTLGLPAALAHLASEFGQHAGLRIDAHTEGPEIDLPDEVKTVLFRVAQEALTNVAKHAQATQVDLSLAFEPDHIELRVNDNGQGFDVDEVSAHPTAGIGLRNMRERLAAIGGRLEVHADQPPGPQPAHNATADEPVHGTLVMATVPRKALQRWAADGVARSGAHTEGLDPASARRAGQSPGTLPGPQT
ncbi:MAG TPA: cache domain-containing protein [Candidatus Aquabacterium excrementipullorum]|nr:cache domain-containing protein [Candidatus Aquabacterium excrementipullorum]